MKVVNLKTGALICMTALPLVLTAPAQAQTASGGKAPNEAENVSETDIVVTAQKRDQLLLQVPLSVTALNSEALAAQNLVRLEDYAARVPSLQVAGTQTNRVTIRGIGSDPAASPTIAVTIDDAPFGSSTYAGKGQFPDLDPADLRQIEVLRGPQGTLYGASSLGGLIKFVTRDADPNDWTARLQTSYSDVAEGGDGYSIRGSVNVPVIKDMLGLRASAFRRHDPSLVDIYRTTGQLVRRDADTSQVEGYRFAASFRPIDALTINASHLYQKRETTNGGATQVLPTTITPKYDYFANDSASSQAKMTSRMTQLRGELDLGAVKVNSISAWSSSRNQTDGDQTNGPFSFILFGYPGQPAGTQVRLADNQITSKFSQELRIGSAGEGKLDWLIGGFYTVEHSRLPQQIYILSPSNTVVATAYDYSLRSSYKEHAVFADATYHFRDQLELQAGIRYSSNKQVFQQTLVIDPPVTGFLGPSSTSPVERYADDTVTWLVSPTFKITPDLMIYARVATGYRPGGPNTVLAPNRTFAPDTVTNYELGFKGKLLNDRLSLDVALFDIEWRNIQLNITDSSGAFTYFVNGGKARSRGLEAQAQFSPGMGFKITGNMTVTDATLRENLPAAGLLYAVGSVGDRLPYTAKFTSNLGVEKSFDLFDDARLTLGLNWNHVGSRLAAFKSSAYPVGRRGRLELPAYDQLDLRAGLSYRNLDLTLFARNVTDERGITNRTDSSSGSNPSTISLIRPRTIGIDAAIHF